MGLWARGPGLDPRYVGIEINGDASIVLEGNAIDLEGLGQTSAIVIDNYGDPVHESRRVATDSGVVAIRSTAVAAMAGPSRGLSDGTRSCRGPGVTRQ